MSRIAIVGNKDKLYYIQEVAESKNMEVIYIDVKSHIRDQMNDIMDSNADWIVYDFNEYIDEPTEVAGSMRAIANTNNASVIIVAIGYSVLSLGIKACVNEGFKNYVLSTSPAERKEEFRKCLNGFYENNELDFIDVIKDDVKKEKRNYTTVAVAGSCDRIGTTTQVIQIIKYLNLKGHSACMIQMNNSDYVELITKYYMDAVVDHNMGKVSYGNIDMFYDLNKLPEILNLDYEYFIYDFGVFNRGDFNKISFLEKSIKIIVGGAKVNEIDDLTRILSETYLTDIKYIFSFIEEHQDTQNDILELMEERSNVTYFAPYAPETFKLAADYSMYEELLPVEDITLDNSEKKKKTFSLFGKTKKGRNKNGKN